MKRRQEKTKEDKRAPKKAKVVREELKITRPKPISDAKLFVIGSGETSQLTSQYTGLKKYPSPLSKFEGSKILDVRSVGYHTALLVEGEKGKVELWTWGCNDDGVLGRVTKDEEEQEPTKVDLKHVAKIAVGDYHMCALTKTGRLYGWGSYKDEEGFLGLSTGTARSKRQFTPLEFDFPELEEHEIVDVASSSNTTIVLTSTGKVFQWGCTKQILVKKSTRFYDRLQLHPHQVLLRQRAVKIFAGGNHHFVQVENGDVLGWGINGYGQLGLGDIKPHERPLVVKGLKNKNVIDMSMGACHTLALTKKGEVYAFGRNAYGQLGIGGTEQAGMVEKFLPSPSPTKITWFDENLEEDEKIIQVCCGSQHSTAVSNKGNLFAWGFGESFLGTGEEDDEPEPKKVGGKWATIALAKKIACGSDFGIIVTIEKK